MASVSAFVSILEEFTNDIYKTFPEDEKIKDFVKTLEEKKETPEGQKELLQIFNEGVKGDNAQLLTQKQSKFFKRSSFCRNLNLHNLAKTMSHQSRDAIWQYLNTMYVLNTTISNIPSELLSTIETMAEQCASQMGSGSGEQMPDMSTLMAGMQNMMSSMNAGGGMQNMMNTLNSMNTDIQPIKEVSKKNKKKDP